MPQTINSFRHEDLPVSLGLLIDSSGSMYDKRAAVEKAALDFVKLSNPEDEEFLVDFSWEAFIDQDFTNNIDKLQQGLGYIKSSGGTAIYDALVASADYLSKNAKHPKQVLLVVTDGEDNASTRDAGADDPEDSGPGWAGDLLRGVAVWGGYGQARVAACKTCAGDAGRADGRGGLLSEIGEGCGRRLPRRWRRISGRSTRSRITRRSRRRWADIARSMWRRRRRALEDCRCGRGAGTIRGSRRRRRRVGMRDLAVTGRRIPDARWGVDILAFDLWVNGFAEPVLF